MTRRAPTVDLSRLDEATRDLDPPFAAIDLDALEATPTRMAARSGGHPIRLASKSIRCRSLIATVGQRPGFAGVMAYSLARSDLAGAEQASKTSWWPIRAWTARLGTSCRRSRCWRPRSRDRRQHRPPRRDRLARAATDVELRLCLDIDCSLQLGPAHLGVRRSPLHTPAQALPVAAAIARRPGMRLVGLMFYDAQIAGLPDSSPLIRKVKVEVRRRPPKQARCCG